MPSSGADPYGPIIARASQTYNVDPRLIRAVIQTESTNNPKAVSPKGAIGLMQVEPTTAQGMGYKGNLTDPQTNINAGTQYLSQLLDKYGDPQKALMAYHGGFDQRGWGPLTQAYPVKVLDAFNKLPASAPASQTTNAPAQAAPAPQHQDAFDQAMAGVNAPAQTNPNAPQEEASSLSKFGHSVAGLADTVLGMPGQVAQQADYAVRRAFQQSPEQAQAASTRDFGASTRPIGNAFGVTNTAGYQGEATQQAGAAIGEKMNQGVNAVAKATGLPAQDVSNMAQSAAALVPGAAGAVVRRAAPIIGEAAAETAANDMARPEPNIPAWQQAKATYGPQPGANPAGAAAAGGMRGSMGAAGTSYAEQARAEGVPDAIVNKIAAGERNGTLNPTAAERHIEAGSLGIDLTEGQATGDVNLLSKEKNMRGQNPEFAERFNEQNRQLSDKLTELRDQVSPNVNVPSGAPTGQALIDAYKEMDAPIQQHISDLYAQARGADGAPALVNSSPQMADFASKIGPTRFNALPANVQQIFRDASSNQVSLPAGFEVNGSSFRPMNVGDLMDIDKTLSGAMRSATDGSVRHDIGALRDSIVNSQLDPSAAGADAFSAYKTAQATARARFQAMDADPAYKAAVNDIAPAGEPSALADDFSRKYVAGGKAANVQNMMQNLSNDPMNAELVRAALMDHLRSQAGIDLRTGSGAVSQAGLNKAITNLGDKTRIVLGPEASQTVEKIGNVARYTQEQPPGSYVNNSNTFVAKAAEAGKSILEGTANKTIGLGVVPVGTLVRQGIAKNALNKQIRRSLEPGAGVQSKAVPLNSLIQKNTGP